MRLSRDEPLYCSSGFIVRVSDAVFGAGESREDGLSLLRLSAASGADLARKDLRHSELGVAA